MESIMQILLLVGSYNLQAIVTLFIIFFNLSFKKLSSPPTTAYSLWVWIIQIHIKLFK